MIRKNLLQLIFSGAYLWRWNDKLRPVELSEIEKQAHKMILACVLCHESSQKMALDAQLQLGTEIIEGGLFDYFYRLIITDIKPPVFYKIKENPVHYQKLTEYALGQLEPVLKPTGQFWERMQAWHLSSAKSQNSARRILATAHLYASRWEFQLIRPHNHFDEEMAGIGQSFENELEKYRDLPAVTAMLAPGDALARFANLCGQLRFQIRWAQAPRIPATSVLGHMFIVAAFAYMFSLSINASQARANNNFFSGLFHDFPELLTRDIISPVKESFSGLSQLIKEYEQSELVRRVLEPLRRQGFISLVNRISWYLGLDVGSEFQECCRNGNKIIKLESFEAMRQWDKNENDPKDGLLLKSCDLLAAFMEAHNSIRNGVSSPHLWEARARIKSRLLSIPPRCLNLEALLADFD